VRGGSARWQQIANEIPMPRITSSSSARVLERLVLEAGDWKTHRAAIFDETLAVGRNEVGHCTASPDVAMEPQTATHRVDHPLAPERELTIRTIVERAVTVDRSAAHSRAAAIVDQLQVIRPSSVDGATAVAVPKYTVHFSAPSDACVAEADQPPGVASGTEIVTPDELRKLSCDRLLL
jgi:hypothetical protein